MNFPAIIAMILGRRAKRAVTMPPLPQPKPKPKPDPNSFVWVYRYECADCGEHVAGEGYFWTEPCAECGGNISVWGTPYKQFADGRFERRTPRKAKA